MASNDPPSPAVTAVEHTEGTSYAVAFGDPARYALPNSDNYSCRDFPAAGGENPYQPEVALLAPLVSQLTSLSTAPSGRFVMQIGNALCVSVYNTLRCVPGRSRGLRTAALINATAKSNQTVLAARDWMVDFDLREPTGATLCLCLITCLYRMCYLDGTVQAFTISPDLATISGADEFVLNGTGEFDLNSIYFNLSPRERKRLRAQRRMPTILARQLIIKKVDKRKLHGQHRRLVYGLFVPYSDELFRVVVSFL